MNPNNFRENSTQIYEWLRESYLDDELAEKILPTENKSEMIFLINRKLQTNLIRKLRLIENEDKPVKVEKPRNFIPKVVMAQSRNNLIDKMREVHGIGK